MTHNRSKREKTHAQVAIRLAAVVGAHRAFPTMSYAHLAAALGLTRYAVRHYIMGDIKAAQIGPSWSPTFWKACEQLANTTQPGRAAAAFEQLARELYALRQGSEQ